MFKQFVKAETITLIIFLVGIFVFSTGITYFGFSFAYKTKLIPVPISHINSFSQVTPAPVNTVNPLKGIYNALFLGYGGAGHDGALLTDSMIVIHVDTNTHKADMVSVPRDLWVQGNTKINAVGVTGFNNVGPVIQNVTGLPINYYISIDFGGFIKLIDSLGGITVNVPNTFDDPFFPITGQESNTCGFTDTEISQFKNLYQGFELERQFTCRYEHLHFNAGLANLDGVTALKFVRSRHGDSDFGRSLRQFAVLEGISNKLISLKSLNKLDQTVNTLFSMVKTDLDLGTIKSLSEVFGKPGLYKINRIQLSTDNVLNQGTSTDGQFILTPKSGNFNYQSIKDYINQNL